MSKNNQNKPASVLKQVKEVSGLFHCLLEHRVVDTKAAITWNGPKIPEEEWQKVLAFFQWTYDTTHSESQVRFYVNPRLQTWKAWAYPQEASTGMSARELDTDEAKAQRAQFSDSEGWLYFGTVHHHCAMSAFQSGTDEANEKNQDGIHITVGNMASDHYTLHERFYLNGQLINHDLNWFYEVPADTVDEVPQWAQKFLPKDIKDLLARGAMCKKVDKDATFPDQWKENLIAKKLEPVRTYAGGLGYGGGVTSIGGEWDRRKKPHNVHFDLRLARLELIEKGKLAGYDEAEMIKLIGTLLDECPVIADITEALYAHDVSLDKLLDFMEEFNQAEAEKELKLLKQGNGVPDYEGPNYIKDDTGYGHLPQ